MAYSGLNDPTAQEPGTGAGSRWARLRKGMRVTAVAVFVFCLANLAWSFVGSWAIDFGGERYQYTGWSERHSGIYSCRGFLVLAARQSQSMSAGMRPRNWQTLRPTRRAMPWFVGAKVSRWPNGEWQPAHRILDDGSPRGIPGVAVVWQTSPWLGEWHTKAIAVHWAWLTAISCIVPIVILLRGRRRLPGLCAHCGYDLRATPERCPECGLVPNPHST
jgi:hypothetical protein